MKKTSLLKLISGALAFVTALGVLVSCNSSDNSDGAPDAPSANENLYDLTGFTIVRAQDESYGISTRVAELQENIEDTLGISLPVSTDAEGDGSAMEILIGETNRTESTATVAALKKRLKDKNSYAIRIAEGKIVITGTDELSTMRAIAEFERNYVRASENGNMLNISAGLSVIEQYDKDNLITLKNGAVMSLENYSVVIEPYTTMTLPDGSRFVPSSGSYPSITQLCHQPKAEDNGKLIATMSATSANGDNTTVACVMMSSDDGKTWSCIARPQEKLIKGLSSVGSMAHIYELPAKVGDMPAGTLLYSYNSVDYNKTSGKSILAVWRSFDCGYTWDEYVIIDEAGGLEEGIWEPFMTYCEEDGYLYCFYSDDSDPDHDQKVVYKRSKDGVNWEGEGGKIGTGSGKDVEPVDVVAINDFSYRPGMPVITKMGNGEYFIVYELVTGTAPIYYKKTKDLSDWGDPNHEGYCIKVDGNIYSASAPACVWISAGGEKGILVVTSKKSSNDGRMFISTDYGETWSMVRDPHESDIINPEQDRVGYSAGFWVGADGRSIYYINSDNSVKNPNTAQGIFFVKIKIFEAD